MNKDEQISNLNKIEKGILHRLLMFKIVTQSAVQHQHRVSWVTHYVRLLGYIKLSLAGLALGLVLATHS
jgi:hypothetical protein